jgi:DNA invertase Pin-like site-specific DNA recombinase
MTELTLEELARRRAELRERLDEVTALMKPLVLAELESGMPEAQAAREFGIDRMTIRKWQGKPRGKNLG